MGADITKADFSETIPREMFGFTKKIIAVEKTITSANICLKLIPIPPI